MLDIYRGRRDLFTKCTYWSQITNNDIVLNSEIVYNTTPTGHFYAKEISSLTTDNQVLGEAFMFESNNVTLQTTDNVSDLKVNDKVVYLDKEYRVDNIQKTAENRQRQFRVKTSYTYYISLRG